jgi:hypothetical protein
VRPNGVDVKDRSTPGSICTLVVDDVTGLNDPTWLDRLYSDALHVVERCTREPEHKRLDERSNGVVPSDDKQE